MIVTDLKPCGHRLTYEEYLAGLRDALSSAGRRIVFVLCPRCGKKSYAWSQHRSEPGEELFW